MTIASTEILALLRQRAGDRWLIGYDANEFYQQVLAIYQQLVALEIVFDSPPRILIAYRQPPHFLAAFLAAVAAELPVFLANPNWSQREWQQAWAQIQPDLVLGKSGLSDDPGVDLPQCISTAHRLSPPYPRNLIGIATGGSSGQIRFAVHTWSTLCASVWGFWQFHQQRSINSVCVLPLYHVSGLMQFLRSFLTGGKIVIESYQNLKNPSFRLDILPQSYFISLVPTQLQTLCDRSDWLADFQTILIGGASPWPDLLTMARQKSLPLSLTYGMTETASGVVTLSSEAFLQGSSSNGEVLPHAQVLLRRSDDIPAQNPGLISIQAQSLFLGYYRQPLIDQPWFDTDDLGFWQGNELYICGRNSQKIISGGENIFPAEVEAAMLATKLVADVCVVGIKDRYWGQAVAAIYVPCDLQTSPATIKQYLEKELSRYKHPKYWIPTAFIPRNAQGKYSYQQLLELATLASQKAEV